MTTDNLTKTAYVLLDEAAALIRANAVGPDVHRHLVASDAWRAQYRAAKEAPAPAPTNKCKGGRGKCGAPAEDLKGPPLWGHELDGLWFCSQECRTAHIEATTIPAPAPEPSAPPAGVPVCKRGFAWCGSPCDNGLCAELHDHRCSGCQFGRTLNPPPSEPVTVATRERPSHCQCPYHNCVGKLENPDHELCDWCSRKRGDECVTVATDPVDDDEIPTAEDGAETCKRLGIDVPAWAADIRARIAAVATSGVPTGYRLGAGWVVDRTYLCSCAGCGPNTETEYYQPGGGGKGACAAHAVLMGALVPIDTARPVPPGTVPVEACGDFNRSVKERCTQPKLHDGDHKSERHGWPVDLTAQPAAPASEPAVRPLSERMRPGTAPPSVVARWRYKVAALEAEVAEARCQRRVDRKELDRSREDVRQLTSMLSDAALEGGRVVDERNAACTEVEQLRGKLAEATARACSMREAARGAVAALPTHEIAGVSAAEFKRWALEAIERLPLDTGTATDAGGEARDRIHAAMRAADEKGCCNLPPCAFRPDGTCTILCDELVAAFQHATGTCQHRADPARAPEPSGNTGELPAPPTGVPTCHPNCGKHGNGYAGIKAALVAANNRAADAFHAYHFHDPSFDAMDAADFEAWLRSGEDAPGAVGK